MILYWEKYPMNRKQVADKGNWLKNIWPALRKNYTDDDIFYPNEKGLFFRLTPDKTFKFIGDEISLIL